MASINAEERSTWKPMHMQPMQRMNPVVARAGDGRSPMHARPDGKNTDVGADIFERGLRLPSDNKMTAEQQDRILEVIRSCFE